MSLVFFVVRNKKDKSQFYQSRAKSNNRSGWVDNINNATIYTHLTGPSQIVKRHVGEEYGEIVPIHAQLREGEFKQVYAIRSKKTGQFMSNKALRRRKQLFTDKFIDAGTWTHSRHVQHVLRLYINYRDESLRINKDEMEILTLPVFIPTMGE